MTMKLCSQVHVLCWTIYCNIQEFAWNKVWMCRPVSSRWRLFFPCEDENQLFPCLVRCSKLNSSLQFHIFPGCCSPVFLARGGATQWRESKCPLQPLHPPWALPQGSTTSSPQLCSKEHPYTLIVMIKYMHAHTHTPLHLWLMHTRWPRPSLSVLLPLLTLLRMFGTRQKDIFFTTAGELHAEERWSHQEHK